MVLKKPAVAGTTESSDVQITVAPNEAGGRELLLNSIVKAQFGDAILETVNAVLDEFEIADARVEIHDRGAFDWVIRARMQAAVCRASETPFSWKEA